ncbi:hypothetical protein CHARACLAT_010458 [Characodon lateralis]|uniref:Uncharacterized protein n=1 Tax=Characodon lateralis TaxID=208331 RepID=A0ABU7EHY8_9TELE|nr:hypothetical protein [Characodon lateralis]
MTSEKQLLGIWEELSELSEVRNPAARKIPPRRNTSLPIFPGVDVPADSAQGQRMKLREMTENPRAPSQTLQASVSRLKVKGHDRTVRETTEPVWLLGRVDGESLFSLETRWQQACRLIAQKRKVNNPAYNLKSFKLGLCLKFQLGLAVNVTVGFQALENLKSLIQFSFIYIAPIHNTCCLKALFKVI